MGHVFTPNFVYVGYMITAVNGKAKSIEVHPQNEQEKALLEKVRAGSLVAPDLTNEEIDWIQAIYDRGRRSSLASGSPKG